MRQSEAAAQINRDVCFRYRQEMLECDLPPVSWHLMENELYYCDDDNDKDEDPYEWLIFVSDIGLAGNSNM